jgi:tetratricopeptide (TPR) repeat protein
MQRRRIKFVWGAGDVIRGHWYLGVIGLYDRLEGQREDGLAISVRGLLYWGAGAAFAAYLAAVTAMFWIWQRNPYSTLTYADALLRPVRREEVRAKQGQAFIAQGTDALHARRYGEAEALLRQGLANFPGDAKARLLLAQFYVASDRRALALKLLEEGLGEVYPGRIFMAGAFALAEQGEAFDFVARVGDRYAAKLAQEKDPGEVRWLRAREFAALMAAERFAEALALAQAEPPGDGADEHRVLALLGAQRAEEALTAAAGWAARPGADQTAALRLRARALREAGRFSEMESVLDEVQRRTPSDPRPRVYGIVQRAMAGRGESARAALEDYIFRFGGTPRNLQLVADPLAEIGQPELVAKCAAAAAERGYSPEGFQAAIVQAALQAGRWAEAARALASMKPLDDRATPAARLWREWRERLLAALGPNDMAGAAFVEFLRRRPWPVVVYRNSVETLRRAGRLEIARDAATVGEGFFPESAWLGRQRTELARVLAEREATAQPAAVSAMPVNSLGERPFWQRLDGLLADRNWGEAERAVREARTAKPPPRWLDAREGDLRWAQVRIARGRGEPLELIAACKLFLNGDVARAQQVLALGRSLVAEGDRATAITLAKEIARTTPEFAAAQTALHQWSQPPAAKK